jgi:hypothetical protein
VTFKTAVPVRGQYLQRPLCPGKQGQFVHGRLLGKCVISVDYLVKNQVLIPFHSVARYPEGETHPFESQ